MKEETQEDINYGPNDKKKYGQSDRQPLSFLPACPRSDGEKYFEAPSIMNQGGWASELTLSHADTDNKQPWNRNQSAQPNGLGNTPNLQALV